MVSGVQDLLEESMEVDMLVDRCWHYFSQL
jgi:hypothetical protein